MHIPLSYTRLPLVANYKTLHDALAGHDMLLHGARDMHDCHMLVSSRPIENTHTIAL